MTDIDQAILDETIETIRDLRLALRLAKQTNARLRKALRLLDPRMDALSFAEIQREGLRPKLGSTPIRQ